MSWSVRSLLIGSLVLSVGLISGHARAEINAHDFVSQCRNAGKKMLTNQVGPISDLTLRGERGSNPTVRTQRNVTHVDGLADAPSQHGTHHFAFRCIINSGSGKVEFTYNNMRFDSPLGDGVVSPLSAAGAAK
jgi:hypothetical protein